MADYWVSQARKYCEFCKCWITDNRSSVEFHERGRRHQGNVQRKLRTVAKQSAQQHKVDQLETQMMAKMETAALAAYKRDTVLNPDLTSNVILKDNTTLSMAAASAAAASAVAKTTSSNGVELKPWKETKMPSGQICYVNTVTNEQTLQPPKDGYTSIAEQVEAAISYTSEQMKLVSKCNEQETIRINQRRKQDEMEEKARLAREKMKEHRFKEIKPKLEENDVISMPTTITYGTLVEPIKTGPYGKWTTVSTTPLIKTELDQDTLQRSSTSKPCLDLQLPKVEYVPTIELPSEPLSREFKERQVTSVEGDVATFKKRKLATGNLRRNARQRLDDLD